MKNSEENIYNEVMNEIFSFQLELCEVLKNIKAELDTTLPADVTNFFEYTLNNITKTIEIFFSKIAIFSNNYYLISEASSAARMVFESITTLLYILKSKNFRAYYDYCYKSKELDEQTIKNIKNFLDSNEIDEKNKKPEVILKSLEVDETRLNNYLEYLKKEYNVEEYTRFPKIKYRCPQLGKYWEFEYLSTYSIISNQLHGNVKNMHHAILKQTDDTNNMKEKYNVNFQLTWISSTLGQFLEEVCSSFQRLKFLTEYISLKEAHIKKLEKLFKKSSFNIVRV